MKFVIVSPPYRENSGGEIVLFELAKRLRDIGNDVSIWPIGKPNISWRSSRADIRSLAGFILKDKKNFNRGPNLERIARSSDLRGAVVIYPEIVAGNPLRAKNVVRWLLNKPAFHTGYADYGVDDLFFYFMKSFDDPEWNRFRDNELCITWDHPAYRAAEGDRTGSCYIVRKGAAHSSSLPDGVEIVDKYDHVQMAAAFHRTERLVSYDLYTRYNIYAAVCGCLPVLVPQKGLSISDWMPRLEDRYGLAYGEENIDWAIKTRPLLLDRLKAQVAREDELLKKFVARCGSYFSVDPRLRHKLVLPIGA